MSDLQPEYYCRVCGHMSEGEPGWIGPFPQHGICPACGAQAGLDDETLPQVRAWREKWIDSGYKWWSQTPSPPNWNPTKDMNNIPSEWR